MWSFGVLEQSNISFRRNNANEKCSVGVLSKTRMYVETDYSRNWHRGPRFRCHRAISNLAIRKLIITESRRIVKFYRSCKYKYYTFIVTYTHTQMRCADYICIDLDFACN